MRIQDYTAAFETSDIPIEELNHINNAHVIKHSDRISSTVFMDAEVITGVMVFIEPHPSIEHATLVLKIINKNIQVITGLGTTDRNSLLSLLGMYDDVLPKERSKLINNFKYSLGTVGGLINFKIVQLNDWIN